MVVSLSLPKLIFDLKSLVCGGYDEYDRTLTSVERFDARVGEWENVASMGLTPRYFGGAALLNGEIYVAGGWNDYETPLETVEICHNILNMKIFFSRLFCV